MSGWKEEKGKRGVEVEGLFTQPVCTEANCHIPIRFKTCTCINKCSPEDLTWQFNLKSIIYTPPQAKPSTVVQLSVSKLLV